MLAQLMPEQEREIIKSASPLEQTEGRVDRQGQAKSISKMRALQPKVHRRMRCKFKPLAVEAEMRAM